MSDDLLADLTALRARTRRDRRAYAVPLFLFGGLILAAPLCYVGDGRPEIDSGPLAMFVGHVFWLRYPELVGWYWVLTIIVGLAGTGWWYRHRARQHGVETDTRLPFVAAGAALVGFLLANPILAVVAGDLSLYSTPSVTLPLLIGAAVLAAVTLYWAQRPSRTGWPRTAGVFAGLVFGTLAVAVLGVYLFRGYPALLVCATALLVLAWSERSTLLAVVATVFTGVALLTNLYEMQNLFTRLGWSPGTEPRALALQALLLPAVVLLVGGTVAAVREAGR